MTVLRKPPQSDHTRLYLAVVGRLKAGIGPFVKVVEDGSKRPPPFASGMGTRAVVTPSHGQIAPATVVSSDTALVIRVDVETADPCSTHLIDLLAEVDRAFFPGDGSMQTLLRGHARSYTLVPVQTVYDAGDIAGDDKRPIGRAGFTVVAIKGLESRKL